MSKEIHEVRVHHIMSLVGGFLGAYGMITRAGNFGSSETTNMISMVTSFLGKDIETAFYRLIALIIYIAAFIMTVIIPKKCKTDVRYISLAIDFVGIIILMFIPEKIDPVIALFPIFFMSAFQYNAFAKIKNYNCATIFSTNNLRQMVIGFTEYITDKNKKELDRGKFFGATLLWYHVGVAVAFFAVKHLGLHGIIVCIPFIILATSIMVMKKSTKR